MVHIMMATYNGEKYIAEQIESILKQTYTEWKLFVRDDGSEDCTTRIIQEYINKYPMKIFMMESNTIYHEAKRNFAALYEKFQRQNIMHFVIRMTFGKKINCKSV